MVTTNVPNPVEQVVQLRSQGLSNNQIIQRLQQQGLSSHDIFDALTMADQKQQMNTSQAPPPMSTPQNPMQNQPTSSFGTPPSQFQQPPMGPPQGGMMPPGMQQQQSSGNDTDEIEELIEAVIDEKWKELKDSVERITDWKDRTEKKISELQTQMKGLQSEFDKLHQAIVGKIGDYDKNILEVGTQLKAMEQVFSDVLPTFTENVQELSRITNKVKGGHGGHKKDLADHM